jgi:hypothetical protein
MGRESRLRIAGLDRVPHDLWPAVEWAPLPLCDRLTLVLLPLGLTFEPVAQGRGISIVPIPAGLQAESTSATEGTSPDRGRDSASGRPKAVDPTTIRVDRITIDQAPVDEVLRHIAGQSGLELRLNRDAIERAGFSVKTSVSVRAENVTLDELLQRIGTSAGLQVRREGRVIELSPPAVP